MGDISLLSVGRAIKNWWEPAQPDPDLPTGVAVTTQQATPATTNNPESGADNPASEKAENNKEEPSSKAWVWIIVLLVLAGLGAGAYFIFFRKAADEDDNIDQLDDGYKSEV